ncbi:MAG TPA: hypothetical protein VJ987_05530 [Anaerolineales bacterium]|nr:hypothetical protein [Anaerolineales bacterium]
MKRFLFALLILSLLAVACGASGPKTADDYAKEYGGSVDVYRQILSSNDCTYLQGQFDTAYEASQNNAPGTTYHKRATGFMTASDQRMQEIGCYE